MDNTPASKLVRTVFFAFAEFERNMIIERTLEGKAIARTKAGFREGRPKKFTERQISDALKALAEGCSYKEVVRDYRISKSTLAREKKKRAELGDFNIM